LIEALKEVLADAGYHQMNQLEEFENRGIECYVAINKNQEQVKEAEHGIVFEYNEAEDYIGVRKAKAWCLNLERSGTTEGVLRPKLTREPTVNPVPLRRHAQNLTPPDPFTVSQTSNGEIAIKANSKVKWGYLN